MKTKIEDAVKRVFNQEFINRIDDIIVFHSLQKKDILRIIDIEMKDLLKRMKSRNIDIQLTKGAREFLADKGFDPQFGARPLNRAIQRYIEDPIAEELMKGKFGDNSIIKATASKKKDGLTFKEGNKEVIQQRKKKKEEKKLQKEQEQKELEEKNISE